MGTDDAADACRGVAEAVRDAGINGIALSSHQVIRLTVNGQHDLTFQYGAYLLTLMLNSLPCRVCCLMVLSPPVRAIMLKSGGADHYH